jgi:hypothetical protein
MKPLGLPEWADFASLCNQNAESINWQQEAGGASFVYFVRPQINRTTGEPFTISQELLQRICCVYAVNMVPDVGLGPLWNALAEIYTSYTEEEDDFLEPTSIDAASVKTFDSILRTPLPQDSVLRATDE